MRFNTKELSAVANQPSYKFDKEGVLLLREKQEGLFRRSDVFSERWCRLRGNLLFYCKTKDQCSEPVGVIVLEQCSVKLDNSCDLPYCFILEFDGEDQGHYLGSLTETERDAWIQALHMASYEYMRSQIHGMKNKLLSQRVQLNSDSPKMESEDRPPAFISFIGHQDPFQNEPFLELIMACDNLKCDADGQPPSPLLCIYTSEHTATGWTKFSQTEVIERSSNPCFLTTVGFLRGEVSWNTRVKLSVYDVRERVSCTRILLGESVFTLGTLVQNPTHFLRLSLLSPACECVGFVTVSVRELEPDTVLARHCCHPVTLEADGWPKADRPRSYSLPTSLPARAGSPFHGQLRNLYANLISQTYRFHTGLGAELRVHEIMAESRISFTFPQLLLNLWIQEEKKLLEFITQLGELRPEWNSKHLAAIERHLHLINVYTQSLEALSIHEGPFFKPSSRKHEIPLEFVPVNLHLQRLWIQNITSRKTATYDTITVGAFTAFPHRYHKGGLLRLLNQLKNSFPKLSKDNVAFSSLGPDRLSCTTEAILKVEHLQNDIEAQLHRLTHLAKQKLLSEMQLVVNTISSKAKQMTHICNAALVEEALAIWEESRLCGEVGLSTSSRISGSHGVLHWQASLDEGYRVHHTPDRRKMPPLQRHLSMPWVRELWCAQDPCHMKAEDTISEHGTSASTGRKSHDSGSMKDWSEKNLQDAAEATEHCEELAYDANNLNHMGKKHSSFQSLCTTANYAVDNITSPTEEFEPLDLTHLNIKASVMCMSSKLQQLVNLASAEKPEEVMAISKSNLISTQEAAVVQNAEHGVPDWEAHFLPSIKKLRQAMKCLRKTSRATYAILALKEPPYQTSLSHMTRYRRDVVFSQALTSLVGSIMTRLWCQQPDLSFMVNISSAGLLAVFLGLLSCYGDEMGMLEDMIVGVEDLRRVLFWLEPTPDTPNPQPRVEGNRLFLSVVIPAPQAAMSLLPKEKVKGFRFILTPVFFNMGVNEQATLAEKFGDISLQDRINCEGIGLLQEHFGRLQRSAASKVTKPQSRGVPPLEVPVSDLLDKLRIHITSKKGKNVEILHQASEISRRLKGLLFVSCKSAKDRTAMSATLEQTLILHQDFDLDDKEMLRALSCMRSEGTRRENTFKNVGVRKYAFNSLQLMALPKLYRPPAGTYGNVQS